MTNNQGNKLPENVPQMFDEIKGDVSVREAGRRGGLSTLTNQGTEFFREIGKKGGRRTAQLYRDFLSEFGKKGGRPRSPRLEDPMEGENQ